MVNTISERVKTYYIQHVRWAILKCIIKSIYIEKILSPSSLAALLSSPDKVLLIPHVSSESWCTTKIPINPTVKTSQKVKAAFVCPSFMRFASIRSLCDGPRYGPQANSNLSLGFLNTVLLEHSLTFYIRSMTAYTLSWQIWVDMTETSWPKSGPLYKTLAGTWFIPQSECPNQI